MVYQVLNAPRSNKQYLNVLDLACASSQAVANFPTLTIIKSAAACCSRNVIADVEASVDAD